MLVPSGIMGGETLRMDTPTPPSEKPELRASDADRDHTASVLQRHFTDGRLTYDELQDRLEEAYAARTTAQLDRLVEDLPDDRRAGTEAGRAAHRSRQGQDARSRPQLNYIATYVIFCLFCVAVWAATGRDGSFWPIWPIIVFGSIAALRLVRGSQSDGP